mgnify:FL=1
MFCRHRFRKALCALHQTREQRRGLAVIDAPRRALAALGGNNGLVVLILPIRVCRRLLQLRIGTLLDVGLSNKARYANRVRGKDAALLRYTARLPYNMVDLFALRVSHNAANARFYARSLSYHGSRMQSVLNGTILHMSRNAADVTPRRSDIAHIPDVPKGNVVTESYKAADIRVPADRPRIVGAPDGKVSPRSQNAANLTRAIDRAAEGNIPNVPPQCISHNAADLILPRHMAVLERDIFDVRSIDIAEQSDPVLIYVPYVKPLNRVSDAVKISHYTKNQ